MTLEPFVRAGDADAVLSRLRDGADVNRRGADGLTPLMVASGLRLFHLSEILLTAGADVHAIDPRMGATALHKAAQAGDPDVAQLLIDHGAFIDQQTPIVGNTPLIDAVLHRHEATADRLLRNGARTAIVNHWGQSALEIARAEGLDAIALRITDHDRASAEQVAALSVLAAVKAGDMDRVRDLISAGAPVDEQAPMIGGADDNYTPLGLAARDGHLEIARRLLNAGADPRRLIGLMGGMALHDATYFGHAGIVRLLTAIPEPPSGSAPGLNVQGAYNGMTALHDAAWQGHPEVARALIDAGARLDLKDHTGATPHALARLHGHREIAKLLSDAEQPDGGLQA
jgi:ankyrin repeat protein